MKMVTPHECGANRGGLDQRLLEDDERSAFGGRGTPVLAQTRLLSDHYYNRVMLDCVCFNRLK